MLGERVAGPLGPSAEAGPAARRVVTATGTGGRGEGVSGLSRPGSLGPGT